MLARVYNPSTQQVNPGGQKVKAILDCIVNFKPVVYMKQCLICIFMLDIVLYVIKLIKYLTHSLYQNVSMISYRAIGKSLNTGDSCRNDNCAKYKEVSELH